MTSSDLLKNKCYGLWGKYKNWIIGLVVALIIIIVIYYLIVGVPKVDSPVEPVYDEYDTPVRKQRYEDPPPSEFSYYDESEPEEPEESESFESDPSGSGEVSLPVPYIPKHIDIPKPDYVPSKARKWKREGICARAIEELMGAPFPSVFPDWLRNDRTGRKLEIDCYNDDLKIGVEHHGHQHFEFPNAFHKTREEFEALVYRDNLKQKLCEEHGVYLIVVPYKVPENQIKDYIEYYLPHNRLERLRQGTTE